MVEVGRAFTSSLLSDELLEEIAKGTYDVPFDGPRERMAKELLMYRAALRDKFGPDVLDRFGEPPDGWMRSLNG